MASPSNAAVGGPSTMTLTLTSHDLANVRVAPSLGPLGETLHSAIQMRQRTGASVFGPWRHRVRATVSGPLRTLAQVVPTALPFLDLVSLAGPRPDIRDSVDLILSAPRDAVRFEVEFFAQRHGRLSAPLRDFADDPAARRGVLDDVVAYYRSAMAPVWSNIQAHLDADHAARAATMAARGVHGLLSTLHPDIHWDPPTLTFPCFLDVNLRLDGRGLVLAPTFFLRQPLTLADAQKARPLILAYPAPLSAVGPQDFLPSAAPDQGLGALLGATRAQLLSAIGRGLTNTGALARAAGISAAAVSQHTRVLREAGMIVTRRHSGGAQHTLTERGANLLGSGARRCVG